MNVPSTVCLPSLKTLDLEGVTYINEVSFQTLLSICPVLEELTAVFRYEDGLTEFKTIIPSLQSLSLCLADGWNFKGYEIDTPSLKYFKLEDWNYLKLYYEIKNKPYLREAYVDVVSFDLKSLLRSIKYVKRLTICSEDHDDVAGDGFVFKQLEHLKLCVCKTASSNLLGQFLKNSPNLRVLDISHMISHGDDRLHGMVYWNEPSLVPECLLSSLRILSWSRYFGRPQERDIAVYILKNARHLKKATILADTDAYVPNLKMIKELTLFSRASSTCELVFVEDPREYESESEIRECNWIKKKEINRHLDLCGNENPIVRLVGYQMHLSF